MAKKINLAKNAKKQPKITTQKVVREKKVKETKPKKVDKKERKEIKKPKSAYFFFLEEKIPDVTKILTEYGAKWKSMKDNEKKKFNTLAEKDKERYKKEVAALEAKTESKK